MQSIKPTAADIVLDLCDSLSPDFVGRFIRLLRAHERLEDITSIRIMREMNNDSARERLSRFVLDLIKMDATITSASLALALDCAIMATRRTSQKQHVDVVWTGPLIAAISLRRSAAVLLELILSAKHEILVISYAAFFIRDALMALEKRCRDGVTMHFIMESEEDSQGRLRRDASAAFSALMGSPTVNFYTWPAAKRPAGALLHAKAIVIDGGSALVTSANLTENAISSNIEIGLLLRGGDAPSRIRDHLKALIASGEFVVQANSG